MLQAQGGAPWLKPNLDKAGGLISVEVHSDDRLGTYIIFFRNKADCDAFDIARFKRDCEQVNAEGFRNEWRVGGVETFPRQRWPERNG